MGRKKDRRRGKEISDADLQEMLDNGEIFSSEDVDFSTNYEASEMARYVAGEVCDCGRTDPHIHLFIKRPGGGGRTEAELQEMARAASR